MRFLRHDLHSLSGAYALDALEEGAEHDRFARHMSRCQSCASEVRGFREVATALAFAAAAGQRHYFTASSINCAGAGTITATILFGPVNYLGADPKFTCH